MDSDNKNIDKEIQELQNKINEMKKGYDYTVHDFAKDNSKSIVYKKEKEATKKLIFAINKIISPPESAK